MTFAGDEHEIPGLAFLPDIAYCFGSGGDHLYLIRVQHAGEDRFSYCLGGFIPGVIVSDDNLVCQPFSNGTHERALALIPIAPTSEYTP